MKKVLIVNIKVLSDFQSFTNLTLYNLLRMRLFFSKPLIPFFIIWCPLVRFIQFKDYDIIWQQIAENSCFLQDLDKDILLDIYSGVYILAQNSKFTPPPSSDLEKARPYHTNQPFQRYIHFPFKPDTPCRIFRCLSVRTCRAIFHKKNLICGETASIFTPEIIPHSLGVIFRLMQKICIQNFDKAFKECNYKL